MNGQMIFKLVVRDLRVYRVQFLAISLIMLCIGMLTIFVNTNTVGIFTSSGSSISMVVMAAFMAEMKNKSVWMHTASLPVTKTAMVKARFLTCLLVCTVNLLLWLLSFNLLSAQLSPDVSGVIGADALLFTWAQILFQLGLYFFVFYRFNMIIIMGVFLLPTMLWTIFSPKATPMSDLVIGDSQLFLGWILVSLILLIGSYFSALSYLKKRDI